MENIMYKRDKSYDGTILQGLVPAILSKSKTEKKKPKTNRRKIDANLVKDDQKLCSKFAESSRYFVGKSVLRSALINEYRTQN